MINAQAQQDKRAQARLSLLTLLSPSVYVGVSFSMSSSIRNCSSGPHPRPLSHRWGRGETGVYHYLLPLLQAGEGVRGVGAE